jgi:hypothetical protein
MTSTMGELRYGSTGTFAVDDRVLVHLERVILAKLRRNESFPLTLDSPSGVRDTVWLNAASTLHFHYDGAASAINRAWLDVLIEAANSPGGLRVIPEPST